MLVGCCWFKLLGSGLGPLGWIVVLGFWHLCY